MGCVVCEKLAEKKAVIVYENSELVAVLPNRPAALGHIKIYSKKHYSKLDQMDDAMVQSFFSLANMCSSAAFDVIKAHGTNIILNETEDHIALDVLPRKENDGLSFVWKPKQATQQELEDISSKIKDKAFTLGKKEAKPVVVEEKKQVVEEIKQKKDTSDSDDTSKDENYLIRNLTRVP